jgi:tetratricopeptide (TPR) repeat protein
MRDQTSETTTTGFLGVVAFEEGALDEAVQHYDRAIAAAIGCGSNVFEAIYRGYRAIALHHMNDDGAAVAYEDAIRVAQAAHAVRYEKLFSAWYGSLLAARGDVDAASRAYDSAAELTDPQAAAFFEMHRAHLDLAWADRAAAGSTERARHEARACRRLDAVRVDASTPRELRVGRRFLEQTLRARASARHDADVVVGWQGRWLEDARRRVSLAGRVPLQHVVWELALRRVLEPGVAVRAEELFEVAWRGEKASANAALHRLHVALSTLRRLGLRDLIELEDGYRFARARTFQLAFAD